MSAEKVIDMISRYSKFLITSHIDSEGDALGSALALASLLKKLGKKAYIVADDRPPENYRFLYEKQEIRYDLKNNAFEALFILDCPTKERIGKSLRFIQRKKPIINIDHHPDNQNFGWVNWVDPHASSTGEMIYRLFELTRTRLDKKDGISIYTALLTDTGSFHHSNTTSAVFNICSELLKLGVEPAKVYSQVYENNSVQDVNLMAKLIADMSFARNNKIAWVKISKDLFKKTRTKHEILDRIFDFAKSIHTIKAVIIFSQVKDSLTKVSLRSKSPVNVQRVALIFGGGGHKFASGCTVKGTFKETEKKVLQQIRKAINVK